MAARRKAPAQAGAGRVSTEPEYVTGRAAMPTPECPADVETLQGLALRSPREATRYWYARQDLYDWRAAKRAANDTPVGSCTRCRRVVHYGCCSWLKDGHCPYGCDSAVRRI